MATPPRTILRIVDKTPVEVPGPRYVARIRWRSGVDPDWEIDTRHPGFETWRQAACFANGLHEEGASILFLHDGSLVLRLVNGRDAVVDHHEIVIWQRLDAARAEMPDDIDFVRVTTGPAELSAMGLDGVLSPMRFGVDDIRGSSRLDVRVEADVQRRAVLVSLAVPRDDEQPEMGSLERQLVQLPEA